MKHKKFPVLATILLVLGVSWLLQDTGIISTHIPWIPVILIIVSIGMIYNRFRRGE